MQRRRDCGELQPLLDHIGRDEERGGDLCRLPSRDRAGRDAATLRSRIGW